MIELYANKHDCCGCSACKNICPTDAITLLSDEEGFLYPQINKDLCIDCGLCKKVCAFQNGYETSDNLDEPEVYAVKHKSDEVRKNSSSGGMFTAISDYIISQNGVIYGATYDESLKVTHHRAESIEDRNSMLGSKYVQSDMKDILKQVQQDLKNSRVVLFTGTTCQIAGLNSFLKRTNMNMDKLITVDIICHGVPSPRIFADYIAFCQKKNQSKILEYHFRSKVKGWGHTEEAVYENGKRDYSSSLSQALKGLFYSNLCLRSACHNCKYTNFKRPSDITIADYWGIENYLPEFKDNLGVSAMIINTPKGKSIFLSIQKNVNSIPSNILDCAVKQRNLYKPTPINQRRDEFWADYSRNGFDYILRKYSGYGLKKQVRSFFRQMLKKNGLAELILRILGKRRMS